MFEVKKNISFHKMWQMCGPWLSCRGGVSVSLRGGARQVREQVVVMALRSSLLLLVKLEWRGWEVFPSERRKKAKVRSVFQPKKDCNKAKCSVHCVCVFYFFGEWLLSDYFLFLFLFKHTYFCSIITHTLTITYYNKSPSTTYTRALLINIYTHSTNKCMHVERVAIFF